MTAQSDNRRIFAWAAAAFVLAAGCVATVPMLTSNGSERLLNFVTQLETVCVYFALTFGLAFASRRFAREALPVFVAIPLISLLYPYNFRVTESNVLMKILQYQDPTLFQSDLTMQSTQAVGGYNFFSRLFSIVPYAFIPQVFYLCWLECLGFIGWFVRRTLRDFLGARHDLFLAWLALAILALTYQWQQYGGFILGDNDLTYNWFRHQSLAWPFCLWALDAYFRRRWVLFGLLTGMVINIHINTGQHLLILIAADWLLFNRHESRRVLAGLAVAGAVASVTIVPIVGHELLRPAGDQVRHGFTLVAGYFRHRHHFIPSAWKPVYYLQYACFLVLGGLCWLAKRPRTQFDRRLLAFVLVSLAGLAAGYIFVELITVDLVTETQFARMTIFTKILLLPYILLRLERFLPETPPISKRWAAAVAIIIALLATASMRHYVIDPPRTPLERMFLENTPATATVMIPPAFGFDNFGERTRRSVAVNMKVFPFARPWYQVYYERLLAESAMPARYDKTYIQSLSLIQMRQNYERMHEDALLDLCRKWGCDYVVRDRRASELRQAKKVFEDSKLAVYQIMHQPPAPASRPNS